MKKKIFTITFLIVILLSLIVNFSFASYSTVTMSVVEEPICTINISKNSQLEKKLISKNLTNKEVTLQLQVTNGEKPAMPSGEIMLVIDNSNSMTTDVTSSATRKDLVFNSAKTFITNILKGADDLKLGIVSFSTNTDISKEGTIADASIISKPTSDITTLTNGILNIETNGPRTDLQAGLLLASQQFSTNATNKYIIVLTDGVPNVAIDYDKTYYSDDVIAKTKSQLQSIENSCIELFTMLTGINNEDYVPAGVTKTFGQIISEIFGTEENPVAGKFYYITDDKIQSTLTEEIYKTLIPTQEFIKDIVVTDYFPKEIIDNFDFSYVKDTTSGTISAKVDNTTNSITWTISKLGSGETAVVQYKLKLKENFDSSIVDKILNTNEKVKVDYTDIDGTKKSMDSNISPKLKLVEPPAELPKAGSTILIGFAIIAGGLFVYSLINLTVLNRKMK